MSLLARMRYGQARWGRPCLTLLTLAWLNVILQPCAMAMTGDTAGCHHSSSVSVQEAESHSAVAGHGHAMIEHGQRNASEHDDAPEHDHAAGHQADSDCTDCGGDLADCANLDDVKKSDRDEQSAPEPKLVSLAAPPAECAQPADPRPPPSYGSGDAARLTGAFPPLNILYCVYLD